MPARLVEQHRDHVLDAIALNDMQATRLHNPCTPEPDSLMEYLEALPMPDHTRRVLRGCVNDVYLMNAREGDKERAAITPLEERARREHRYPVKRLAQDLRPLLGERDGLGFVRLTVRVRELLAHEQVGRDVLLSGALAHELGTGGDGPADWLATVVSWVEAAS